MSLLSNQNREDVEKTIRSCLIASKGGVTIQQLDKDYCSIEGERIPFREFQCNSLISFLEQLRNVLWIEQKNGFLYAHAVDSEKSRHVAILVQGQKNAPKKLSSRKSFRPTHGFAGGRTQVSINSKLLLNLVREVNLYEDGVNIDWAIQFLNKICWPVEITRNELERQLRNISHEVNICGNSLYSTRKSKENLPSRNSYVPPPRFNNTTNKLPSSASSSRSIHRTEEMNESIHSTKSELPPRFTGEDDPIDVVDEVEKFPSGFKPTTESRRVRKIDTSFVTKYLKENVKAKVEENGLKSNTVSLQNCYTNQETSRQNSQRNQESSRESSNHFQDTKYMEKSTTDNRNYEESRRVPDITYHESYEDDKDLFKNDDTVDEDFEDDRSILINDRIRARLSNLIQNNPEGIWCADLPQKYIDEFRISLHYAELGFDSVREFASQLPTIFHCVRPTNAGDYKLYNAKLPPPDLRNKEPQFRETLASKYLIYNDTVEDPEAFPDRLHPNTCKKLIPEGAMEFGETVGHISVTELGKEHDYEEVEVSEVFAPSFFWIQLRKKMPKFRKFMADLHLFYENKKSQFPIPLFMLEKGLNVACLYSKKWHRGIIRRVQPDGRSIVHFYDYGTVKSYAPDELYFLHRQFSYLSAQAIPCGLFNVRPYQTDKWSKAITYEFILKTSCPLIATIGARDEQENSMLVTLTDTRGDEDFHINDWMYHKNYAEQGRMVRIRSRNFAFSHYRECLEKKGYDPNAIHKLYTEYDDSELSASNSPFFPIPRENLPTEVEANPVEIEVAQAESVKSKIVETKTVIPEITKIKPIVSESVESKPVSGRLLLLKRTQDLISKHQTEKGKHSKTPLSPDKETSISSGYVKTSESQKSSSSSNSISSSDHLSKIEILLKFMNKSKSSKSTDSPVPIKKAADPKLVLESSQPPLDKQNIVSKNQIESCPTENRNVESNKQVEASQRSNSVEELKLGSKDKVENLNLDSKNRVENPPKFEGLPVTKSDSSLTVNSSDSDSIPICPPLLLNEVPEEEKKEITFFGNLTSECGGSGRMEPMDWSAIRTAMQESDGQFATLKNKKNSRSGNSKSRFSNKNVPLSDSGSMFFVDADSNSAQYEKDVKWLPAGNVKHSRTSVSPLLKLKQRLLVNSYKKSAVMISSKMVSILKGELLTVSEEDETAFSIVSDTSYIDKFYEAENGPELEKIDEAEIDEIEKIDEAQKVDEVEKIDDAQKIEEIEKIDEAQKIEEIEKVVEVEKIDEVQKIDEVKEIDEVQKVDEVEMVDEVQKVDEAEDIDEDKKAEDAAKAAYLERIGTKVRLYLEANKLRAYQDPYSSLSSATDEEGKPKLKTGDLSSLIKGFVNKNVEFREEMAKRIAVIQDMPEVTSTPKKKKKKKSKKKKSKATRSSSSSPNSMNSSNEGADDLPEEDYSKIVEIDELPKLDNTVQKSLENEDNKLSTLDEVSSILTNECVEGNKLDSTILTNGFIEDEDPSINLLDEKDPVPDPTILTNSFATEEDTSIPLLDEKDQVPDLIDEDEEVEILNSLDCLPMKTTNSIVLERLKMVQSLSSSCESLDSDDLSSSDNEEEQLGNQIKEWKTSSSEVNLESSKVVALANSSIISQEKESQEKTNGNNIIYEEILLNPESIEKVTNKEDNHFSSNLKEEKVSDKTILNSPSIPVPHFNDLDLSNDEEQWDVVSYLSSESYTDFKKHMNQYVPLQIEEVPKEVVHSMKEPKTEEPSSNGIIPPNFKYPDEMKLPSSTQGAVSSRISSPDRVKNAVNGTKQEFVNFQYTQEMKSTRESSSETENSCTEGEENLTHPESLDDDDFMLGPMENSSLTVKEYEPPGKKKSLKDMLRKMQQK